SALCAIYGIVPDVAVGTKWGSKVLFSTSISKHPFIMSSSTSAAKGNDSNKFKMTRGAQGVVHVHKLPSDVPEGKVISLGLPFGKVTNLLMLKKNQAFIEMNTEEAANTIWCLCCVDIYIQFPNNKKLKTHSSPNQAHAQTVLQAVNSVQFRSLALAASTAAMDVGIDRPEPRAQDHCVTPDVHQIFSEFGTVLKIIIFTKNKFQALLQYADPVSAQHAKLSLDGQNTYNACCTLSII
ncbi:hypothetical protein A6R68_22981, partial [Neotoma lepida]